MPKAAETGGKAGTRPVPPVREALDAEHREELKANPAHEDAKLDIALDETFPSSDAPANTAPGAGEPAPSSGYDEAAERRLEDRRKRAYTLWEQEGRPEGRHDDHWHSAGEDDIPEPGTAPWTEGP